MREQEAYLNEIAISSISSKLLLQHIDEGPLEYAQTTAKRPYGGTYLLSNAPTKREITVSVAIREGLNFADRATIYQALCGWCAPGWLRVSERPDQRIYVYPTHLPDLGKLREWTKDLDITLTAFWAPYWQALTPTVLATMEGTSGSRTISKMPGTAPGILDLAITPTSADLTSLTLRTYRASTIASTVQFNFTEAPIAAGETLAIEHDERGLLTVKKGTTGMLKYRTPASADDLILTHALSDRIYFTANTACQVVASYRGCWV